MNPDEFTHQGRFKFYDDLKGDILEPIVVTEGIPLQCDIGEIVDPVLMVTEPAGTVGRSASESVIFSGMFNARSKTDGSIVSKKVFVKIGSNHEKYLLFEGLVYSDITTYLYNERYTPNIMGFIGLYMCPDATELIRGFAYAGTDNSLEIAKQINIIDKSLGQSKPYQTLIMEAGYGNTLMNAMHGEVPFNSPLARITDDDLRIILFQAIYTLQVFYLVGLRHNDPHCGNIFVMKLSDVADSVRPDIVYYTDPSTYYVVPQRHVFCKIFDYDNSAVVEGKLAKKLLGKYIPVFGPDIIDNVEYMFCKDSGQCDNDNKFYDIFMFLQTLRQIIERAGLKGEYPDTMKFMDSAINQSVVHEITGTRRPHVLCNAVDDNYGDTFCDGDINLEKMPWLKNVVMSPENALQHRYFRKFRNTAIPSVSRDRSKYMYALPGVNIP
jgi:hypothetical protein